MKYSGLSRPGVAWNRPNDEDDDKSDKVARHAIHFRGKEGERREGGARKIAE